eukprot:jgi/Mesen1/416/ME000100S10659
MVTKHDNVLEGQHITSPAHLLLQELRGQGRSSTRDPWKQAIMDNKDFQRVGPNAGRSLFSGLVGLNMNTSPAQSDAFPEDEEGGGGNLAAQEQSLAKSEQAGGHATAIHLDDLLNAAADEGGALSEVVEASSEAQRGPHGVTTGFAAAHKPPELQTPGGAGGGAGTGAGAGAAAWLGAFGEEGEEHASAPAPPPAAYAEAGAASAQEGGEKKGGEEGKEEEEEEGEKNGEEEEAAAQDEVTVTTIVEEVTETTVTLTTTEEAEAAEA